VESFGSIIRRHRTEQGVTLETVAKKCGTHKGYVSGIENGRVNPPGAKVTKKLCAALDLRVNQMIALGWIEKAPKEIEPLLSKWYRQEFLGG